MSKQNKYVIFLSTGNYIIFDSIVEAKDFCRRNNITWFDEGGWL